MNLASFQCPTREENVYKVQVIQSMSMGEVKENYKNEFNEIAFPNSKSKLCINCGFTFNNEFKPISEVSISFLSAPVEDWGEDEDADFDESATNVSVLDALLSIFASPKLFELKESNPNLKMCLRCANALSNLYQSYIELLSISAKETFMCEIIPQISVWQTQKLEEENINQEDEGKDPFAEFVKSLIECEVKVKNQTLEIQKAKEELDELISYSSPIPSPVPINLNYLKEEIDNDNTCEIEDATTRRSTRIAVKNFSMTKEKPVRYIVTRQSPKTTKRKCDEVENFTAEEPIESPAESDSETDKSDLGYYNYKGKQPERRYYVRQKYLRIQRKRIHKSPDPTKKIQERAKCTIDGCKKKFLYHWEKNNHVMMVHENKTPETCQKCKLYSFDPEVLKSHICAEKRDPEKPWRCLYCGRVFATTSTQTQHSRTHDRTILKCSFPNCNKTFLRLKILQTHIRFEHSEAPDVPGIVSVRENEIYQTECQSIQCAICGKLFYQKQQYKVHLEIHNTERNYLCNSCGMSFKQKRALTRHYLIHSEIRRFTCALCGKSFKRKYNLTQHYNCKIHPHHLVEKVLKGEEVPPEELNSVTMIKRKRRKDTDEAAANTFNFNNQEDSHESENEALIPEVANNYQQEINFMQSFPPTNFYVTSGQSHYTPFSSNIHYNIPNK